MSRIIKLNQESSSNVSIKKLSLSTADVKEYVRDVFDKIATARCIEDLKNIERALQIKFDDVKYPKLTLPISRSEIEYLQASGVLDTDGRLISPQVFEDNPLAKILYGVVWKQGDLTKIKHIVRGILNAGEAKVSQDKAQVFYQFGKHLADQRTEPIIDQHILRAFKIFKYLNATDEKFSIIREMQNVTIKDKDDIEEYKLWLFSNQLSRSLREDQDYIYYIDRILFSVGKRIKKSKEKRDKSIIGE